MWNKYKDVRNPFLHLWSIVLLFWIMLGFFAVIVWATDMSIWQRLITAMITVILLWLFVTFVTKI
jgi:hypothetical protein